MRHELLTILFIRSSYKIRKINMPFLYYQFFKFLGIAFLLLFIALIVITSWLYSQNKELASELLKLKNERRNAYMNNIHPEVAAKPEKDIKTGNTPVKLSVDKIDSQWVDIRDLMINSDDRPVSLTFNLANTTAPNQQVSGYIYISLLDQLTTDHQEIMLPAGVPFSRMEQVNEYNYGDSFSIKYFKMVKYQLPDLQFPLKHIWVRIYSSSGNIIFQKILPVAHGQE